MGEALCLREDFSDFSDLELSSLEASDGNRETASGEDRFGLKRGGNETVS